MSIAISVNASYAEIWDGKKLAEIIKNLIPPQSERIYVLFTEIPLQLLIKFCYDHDIPLELLKTYYEKYIKPVYRNQELEEYLYEK